MASNVCTASFAGVFVYETGNVGGDAGVERIVKTAGGVRPV